MKQLLKFLHQLGAIGVIGALVAHMVLVVTAARQSVAGYVAVRFGIEAISKWMLVPSLALVLVSGLLAIAAHRPFIEARWAWVKALLGLSMFEGNPCSRTFAMPMDAESDRMHNASDIC